MVSSRPCNVNTVGVTLDSTNGSVVRSMWEWMTSKSDACPYTSASIRRCRWPPISAISDGSMRTRNEALITDSNRASVCDPPVAKSVTS